MAGMQVVQALPDHLLITVLSHTTLPRALLHLPAACHLLALRAHRPSVDIAHTLNLHGLTAAGLNHAMNAAQSLTHLCTLSLASQTLPRDPPALAPLLCSLPALTALTLSDAALSPAATAALAAALPALHDLRSLDLSGNHLPAAALRDLAPAVARCPALTALRLLSTLRLDGPDCTTLATLATAIQPLSRLATLAVGGASAVPDPSPDPALSSGVTALLETLAALPRVSTVHLELTHFKVAVEHVPRFAAALARLTHVTDLYMAVPHLGQSVTFADDPSGADGMWGGPRDILGAALGALTCLATLQLETRALIYNRRQAAAALTHLSALTALQSLSMQLYDGRLQTAEVPFQAAVVLRALPRLAALTELRCHCFANAPRAAITATLIDLIASAMPELRVLHIPLEAVAKGAERLVADLLGLAATHLRELSVDMHAVVEYSLDQDAYADEIADEGFLAAYVPLFPHVRMLYVFIYKWHDNWLAPVAENVAALTALRRLVLTTSEIDAGGPVTELLRGVAALPALCDLDVHVTFEEEEAPQGQPWFSPQTSALTGITSLQCTVYCGEMMATGLGRRVLPACPRLRQLHLRQYPVDDHDLLVAELAGVPVRTLVVAAVQARHVGMLCELVVSLGQLRTLRLHGKLGLEEQAQIEAAAAESAACHDLLFDLD